MNELPEDQAQRDGIQWQWVAGGLALVLLVLVTMAVFGVFSESGDQDRLGDVVTQDSESMTPEQLCTSQAVHDRIRDELFRRAAEARGGDAEAFETIAGHASARMEAPMATGDVDDDATVGCTGLLWLDLPPGIVIAGGRRTISADLIYTVRRNPDGDPILAGVGNAEAIVTPLAALSRVRSGDDAEPTNVMDPAFDPMNQMVPVDPLAPIPAPPPGASGATADAGPSFDCQSARTRSEIAVCNEPQLAALDRRMAEIYRGALNNADDAQAELLQRTRDRFLAYREGCRTSGCIASAYEGRMREIRDIMAGRWQAPR